jgi:hypothetical protein
LRVFQNLIDVVTKGDRHRYLQVSSILP